MRKKALWVSPHWHLVLLTLVLFYDILKGTKDRRLAMYSFIVNPNASGGRGERIWRRLEKQLKHLGVPYEAFVTEKTGDARRLACDLTEHQREPRILIAVGGDGTVSEVLDGISFCGPVTLGYIPTGSGNDLASSLRLPKSPSRCLKKILNPKYHKLLDYGVLSYGDHLTHRRFMVSTGIGMDAMVCQDILHSKTKRGLSKVGLGKLSYMLVGAKRILFTRPVKGYLVLDGAQKVEFNHIYFVAVHNHPYEGGGFRFAPGADPGDGRLNVCVIHSANRLRVLKLLISALFGMTKKKKNRIRCYTCQEVEIHMDQPMAVHADGEDCLCQQDIHVRCIPQKLRMIV